jgi:hypothetical protein
MHRRIVDMTSRRAEPWNRLPNPFATVIPNSAKIVEATEEEGPIPATFRHKYSAEFAKLFEAVCGEILERAEYHRTTLP